jgi:LysR family transcriptional regulator, glycine cleavage system transcriptional activator
MDSKRRRARLSLDLLKGFEAAARHLSFTHAARELSLTQSAVSREIKTLEEQVGQPLFNRVNRGLRLTDAGQMLYRAVGEALTLIDEATDRLATSRGAETLTVTTSVPLASMWLVPKLRRFVRLRPEVDVRSVAADQRLDLKRERLDIAIRWGPPESSVPGGEPLFDMEIFPVCSPTLARDRARPLRNPADLANHVLLDLETVTTRGPWSDWGPWLEAMKLGELKPAGTLRFSHYDQVVQAAIDGSGVAIGRNPHNARHLREGLLVAPFGNEAMLSWGTYFVLIAPRSAERPVVKEFVAWLRDEIRQDAGAEAERKGSDRRRSLRHAGPTRARPLARAR